MKGGGDRGGNKQREGVGGKEETKLHHVMDSQEKTQTLLGDLSGMQFIRSCSLRTGQWEGVVLEVESGVLVLRTVVSGVLILGVVECGVPVVPGSRNVI